MSENSKIEWTDHTFNPWTGCTKISPGCDHCYAESWAKRSGHVEWGGQRRRTTISYWQQPFKWNDAAKAAGRRARVFCASLADVFDNTVSNHWRWDLFALIRNTPYLDWLLLTKRIGNARAMLNSAAAAALDHLPGTPSWDFEPWPNVWLGATVVNQEEATRDVPKLVDIPARVRFLSCEPLLGEIDFAGRWINHVDPRVHENVLERIHWVIVGGESGGGARPMSIDWATLIREQCRALDVAFFMKQGSAANWPHYKNFESFPDDLKVRDLPRVYA
jgi:protein gp37